MSEKQNPNTEYVKVVLFGSILSDPANARDIDVAVAYADPSDWTAQYTVDRSILFNRTLDILQRWAQTPEAADVPPEQAIKTARLKRLIAENRLGFDLHFASLEASKMPGTEDLTSIHVSGPGSSVEASAIPIPSPMGIEVPYLAITANTNVIVKSVRSIPAALRANPNDSAALEAAINDLLFKEQSGLGGLYSAHLDIGGPYHDSSDRQDWDTYVTGLVALRNAIQHCPAFKQAQFPGKRLLARLNARGASVEGIQYARNYSPGNRARLFFTPTGVTFEYSGEVDYRSAEEMFVK